MPKYVDAYVKVLRGDEQTRTKFESDTLDVEEQVTCLIEVATDPGVLGIMYADAMPWA